MKVRAERTLVLALSLATLTGCGGEPEIRVQFEESQTPASPVVTAPPAIATPTPAPSAPVTSPATAETTAAAVVSSGVPAGSGPLSRASTSIEAPSTRPTGLVPHSVAIDLEAPFFPRLQVSLFPSDESTSVAAVHDLASPDGFGVAGKLASIPAGDFRLRLLTPQLPDFPMFEGEVHADGRAATAVTLGWVQFDIPPGREAEVGRGIQLELLQEPVTQPERRDEDDPRYAPGAAPPPRPGDRPEPDPGRPVFRGPLGHLSLEQADGKQRPLAMLLPLGTYSFGLKDLDPEDRVSIIPTGTGPGLVLRDQQNNFELTAQRPSAIVDLSSVLETK